MEKRSKNLKNKGYQPSDKNLWKGRVTNISSEYWYQEVECIDLNKESLINHYKDQKSIGIIGYACDEGIERNQGRTGAFSGPLELRKKLAKIPLHFENKHLIDFGDVVCNDQDMEACQNRLSAYVSSMLNQDMFPIVIGGGHDIAYGHFMGLKEGVKDLKQQKIGIINFDAHFDLRPLEEQGNSGTPFYQINSNLKKENTLFNYLVLGIQEQSNTKELFRIAQELEVKYVLNQNCYFSKIKKQLDTFIEANDSIYITIDMDGFSSAYAPGVSAPSTLGFSPSFVFETLDYLFKTNKVISCDIAELNPTYDLDGRTAHLAARLVDFMAKSC